MVLPAAHVGHYIWVLYVPPILIVAGSIAKSKLQERRQAKSEPEDSPGEPRGPGPRT